MNKLTYILALAASLAFVGCKKKPLPPFIGQTKPEVSATAGTYWDTVGGRAFNFDVNCLEVYNGELFIGGDFTQWGSSTTYSSASFNGATISTHTGNSFVFGGFEDFHLDDDGNLYAAGAFQSTFGPRRFGYWNGSSWTGGFDPGGTCYAVGEGVSGSDITIGGNIGTYPGIAASSTPFSSASTPGSGLNGTVYDIIRFNGRLIACGQFTTSGSQPLGYIAEFNGSNWVPIVSPQDLNNIAYAMVEFEGHLYVAGDFTQAFGVSNANHIIKYVPNTNSWEPVGTGLASTGTVKANALYADATGVYVGGSFQTAGGVPSPNIALWDNSSWKAIGNGVSETVNDITIYLNDIHIATARNASSEGYVLAWK